LLTYIGPLHDAIKVCGFADTVLQKGSD